jgi:hypothetical protein
MITTFTFVITYLPTYRHACTDCIERNFFKTSVVSHNGSKFDHKFILTSLGDGVIEEVLSDCDKDNMNTDEIELVTNEELSSPENKGCISYKSPFQGVHVICKSSEKHHTNYCIIERIVAVASKTYCMVFRY